VAWARKRWKKKLFFELADRLSATGSSRERRRIKKELAGLAFGE
jgi:hypothetical protein